MEEKSNIIEVSGVPEVLAADRMVDKLFIHFLRPRHGGGEVLKVLYPCYEPGKAFIVYEEPQVAARVLRKSSHVFEVGDKKYRLTVKAPDAPAVGSVGATLDMQVFRDKSEVQQILLSHGLVITKQRGDVVRVEGSFSKLRAVKARLEELQKSQTKMANGQSVYSAGVWHYYTNERSVPDGNRSPEGPQEPRHTSARPGRESFIMEEDVLKYARQFMEKEMDMILQSHNVKLEEGKVSAGICSVLLEGRSAKNAAGKLQTFLDALGRTLRTQEVHLGDMDEQMRAALPTRIQKYKDIYKTVLISQKDDRVRLIGPSVESYELKQRLLGKPTEPPVTERTGRTQDKSSKRRSSSLPRISQKNTERGSDAAANPSGAEPQSYSPSKYQDVKVDSAGAHGVRRRSNSVSREPEQAEKADGDRRAKDKPPPRSPKQPLIDMKDLRLRMTFKKK
ncbi:RNA-binding protein 43 [Genypterus blacodes]|uniref:RNA-binding protein 43 n=1 Tax=Genypterus blacodes TaxID=154954 RepID=UPI003F76A1D1